MNGETTLTHVLIRSLTNTHKHIHTHSRAHSPDPSQFSIPKRQPNKNENDQTKITNKLPIKIMFISETFAFYVSFRMSEQANERVNGCNRRRRCAY